MAAQELHRAPEGESHLSRATHKISADCPCGPDRVVISKRNARGRSAHQGYRVERIEFYHHTIQGAAA